MPDIDQISLDELYRLLAEIKTFLDSYEFSERAYSEGSGDFTRLRIEAEEDFSSLRSRLRGLAIDWGIHADFLKEYSELERQRGLKISA